MSQAFISSKFFMKTALRGKCPYSELFWSAFSHIRTEYGQIPLHGKNTDTFHLLLSMVWTYPIGVLYIPYIFLVYLLVCDTTRILPVISWF